MIYKKERTSFRRRDGENSEKGREFMYLGSFFLFLVLHCKVGHYLYICMYVFLIVLEKKKLGILFSASVYLYFFSSE